MPRSTDGGRRARGRADLADARAAGNQQQRERYEKTTSSMKHHFQFSPRSNEAMMGCFVA